MGILNTPTFSIIAGLLASATLHAGGETVPVVAETPPPVEPVPAIFVNLSTSQVSSGSTPTSTTTTTINPPGFGWNFSAAAPVAGTKWNNILRPNPLIGSNSSSVAGQYACNSANQIALSSATGEVTPVTLTVSLDIQDLESGTTRTEPNTGAAGATSLGPSGLMGQCWRVYRGGNGSNHRIGGLPAGAHCYLYCYGSTTTAGQGCKFIIDAANVPGGNGSTTRFVETRGSSAGNVFTNNGNAWSPTAPAPVDTVSTATDNHTWGRLHAVVDATGTLVFRTAKNTSNGQYLNGYQIVPFPLPVIALQPPPAPVVTLGTDISLTATVTGEGALSFQWRKDGQPVTGNPTALTPQLDLTGVQAGAAGEYDLVVTNEGGSVTSTTAKLTVTTAVIAPTIQTQPANRTAITGQNVTFNVLSSGTTPLTYLWEKSLDGLTFEPIPGGDPVLTLSNVQFADAGRYRVTVGNSISSVTSEIATLTLAPVIVTPPAGGEVAGGAPHTISVAATAGSGSPTALVYLWKKDGVALTDGAGLTGTGTASLQFAAFTLANSGLYTVAVSNPAGSATTTAAYFGVPSPHTITRLPAVGATAVNRDTTLRITFSEGAPVVGSTGRIRLFRASDHALIETIDLAAAATLSQKSITDAANVTYRYFPKSLGGNTYKYLPVVVAGNTAIVTFSNASLLVHGQTYYVKVDAGAILDATGATHPQIDDPATWRFTVKPTGPSAGANLLRVAADGSADFTTIQGAIEHVPSTSTKRITILVAPGDYFEYVVVKNRPLVTLRGDGANPAATRLACLVNNNVYNLPPSSSHLGARGVFCIDGSPDFVMDNLTVQNLTAKGGSQAEAVVTRPGSPRCIFNNLRLLSFQDTNLIADVFVKDSYVEGDVDFMWGGGTVFYQNCELRAMNNGYYAQYRTSAAVIYGGIYVNCRFTAKSGLGANTQVLNRINPVDYPHAQMVLVDCAVGPHVKANPWQLDGGAITAPTLRVWEYQSTDLAGNLLNVSGRPTFNAMATGVGGSTVLPNQQIDAATAAFLSVPSNIFGGWTPVVPQPPSAYDEFAAIHGLDPATTGIPTADPEHDGLVNALEFLLGGDPLASDVHDVSPSATMDSQGALVFTYRRQTAAAGLFTDTVETTDNLVTWSAAIHGVAGVTVEVIPLDTQSEQIAVRFPPAPNRRFARLRVTSPT